MKARELKRALFSPDDGLIRVYSRFPEPEQYLRVEEFILDSGKTVQTFERIHPVTRDKWIATATTKSLKSGITYHVITWARAE